MVIKMKDGVYLIWERIFLPGKLNIGLLVQVGKLR